MHTRLVNRIDHRLSDRIPSDLTASARQRAVTYANLPPSMRPRHLSMEPMSDYDGTPYRPGDEIPAPTCDPEAGCGVVRFFLLLFVCVGVVAGLMWMFNGK